MKYHYRIWCPDCCNQDYEGCFDGQVETDTEMYDTPEEAATAGLRAARGSIYEYEVIDENGKVVEL